MIVNHYLADRNTTELLKISGLYKFDSWLKHYTLTLTLALKPGQVFPEEETTVNGQVMFVVSEMEVYSTFSFTDNINETGSVTVTLHVGDVAPTKISNGYVSLQSTVSTNFEDYLDRFYYTSDLLTSVEHLTGIETALDYTFEEATVDKYYKVQYRVEGTGIFSVYPVVGTTKGTVVSTDGTYTDYLKMTEVNKVSFFASGYLTLSDFSIEEYVVIADKLDFTDTDAFINYSWTLSYSLDYNNWVSFHSYIPDFYLTVGNNMYSLVNDELSVEYTIRDEDNNYIVGSENEVITYYAYTSTYNS